MKYIKKFESIEDDIDIAIAKEKEKIKAGKYSSSSQEKKGGPYDFDPRRGTLMIIKNNTWEYYHFREAYREVIYLLEKNKIDPNISMKNIRRYVNSLSSDITNAAQYKNGLHGTLTHEQKILINLIISKYDRLFDMFQNTGWRNRELSLAIGLLLSNTFDLDFTYLPSIIYNMKFYYDGFVLDLNTKKWTPENKSEIDNENDDEIVGIFKDYDFQKEYLKNDPQLIYNIPELLLNDEIKSEYQYIFQSNKYNL